MKIDVQTWRQLLILSIILTIGEWGLFMLGLIKFNIIDKALLAWAIFWTLGMVTTLIMYTKTKKGLTKK